MHRRASRFSADDHDSARGFVRQVAGDHPTLEDQDPDDRTADDRAQQARTFHGAMRDARRIWNPSAETLHLQTLAFVGGVLSRAAQMGVVLASEQAQYVFLYEAKRAQMGGRMITPDARERLRFVSREVWAVAAQLTIDLTPTPTPTLGSARVTAACVA
jgi:hypothetical protein